MKLRIVNNPYPELPHVEPGTEVSMRYVERKMQGVFIDGRVFGVRNRRWYFWNSDLEVVCKQDNLATEKS